MTRMTHFSSKSEATRFYVIETLKTLEDGRYLSKRDLKFAVDSKLEEINFGSTNEAAFSQTLKILTALEDTPITKNPLARGLYGYDNEKSIDFSVFKTRKTNPKMYSNSGKFDNRIIIILNEAKKQISDLLGSEQVPLTVLLDNNSDDLEKYKEKIRFAKESTEGIDTIIYSLTNKEEN